ncbi:MAG: hypothetical protein JSV49_09205 [Thermoplasmata archaeon]|nr:MAG: hypothetical protein JSV49_09205 [Thermoplasmata archaeon]
MKIIAVMTENFSLYYDIVKILKKEKLPFLSLSFEDKIPPNVGVIITNKSEKDKVKFHSVVLVEEDIPRAVDESQKLLSGKDMFSNLIIGIDPGKRPGIAVLGDGDVIQGFQTDSPEGATEIVKQILELYQAQEIKIRIGHGAPTYRNRIINAIFPLKIPIEIVNETNTTHKVDWDDIRAAVDIALTSGYLIKSPYQVEPRNGELKNIQRISRLESDGAVTISMKLAKEVALGNITLEEAIKLQKLQLNSI